MVDYLISTNKLSKFKKNLFFGGGYVSYSEKTSINFYYSTTCSLQVCIIGYCIDARGEYSSDLLSEHLGSILIKSNYDWSVFLKETSRLAGNFVIVVYCSEYFRLLSDATGCVGIYYDENSMACSSSDAVLAEHIGAKFNPLAEKIRKAATGAGQPLPNNITDFKDIYITLPNFYLDLTLRVSVRYFPNNFNKIQDSELSVEECLSRTYALILNIVNTYIQDYCSNYTIICPITAGWDSRLNYSFFKTNIKLKTFTFMLPGFNDKTPDIFVPKVFLSNLDAHKLIKRQEAPESIYKNIKAEVTPHASNSAVSFAYNLLEEYDNPVFISGDVVDQIGGSLIGQDLPEIFAQKSFFKCKLHNFSPEADLHIQKWIQSTNVLDSDVSLYDLFAWESRLGRWAHDRNKIYSSMGVVSLNIYNCREVLELWLQIPRKERNKMEIHSNYFSINDPTLLEVPFNPKNKLAWMKSFNFTFLLATYAKYYLDFFKRR